MIRSLFRRLFPELPTADRLALDFRVTPSEAQRALDRLDGDAHKATLLLVYAARWHRDVDGALADFGAHVREGLTIWEDTVEGRRMMASWRLAQAIAPRRWWLDVFDRIDSRARRAWNEAARRGAERAAEAMDRRS